jgi:DnaK suppressor protein
MKKTVKKPIKQGKKQPSAKIKSRQLIKAKGAAHPKKTAKTTAKIKVKSKAKKIIAKSKAKKIIAETKTKSNKTKVPMKIKASLSKTAVGPVDVKPYKVKLGEVYMNPDQLEHFKNILLKWEDQLFHEAEITKQDIQTTSANFPDPIDRASLEEEFNLELRTRDRERKLIKKIEEALQRIKENSYGYCDDCGAEIGVRRLEARPTATQCIECKTVSEMKEKQVGEIEREEE